MVLTWLRGWLSGRRRRPAPVARKPYRWDDDEPPPPQDVYQPSPGEVRFRGRQSDQAPTFTDPSPGEIPAPRESAPAPGGPAYTTGHADIPPPRERTRAAAEYTVSSPGPDAGQEQAPPPLTSPQPPPASAVADDPYLPAMAPPPLPPPGPG